MKYRDYEIRIECITGRSIFNCDDEGNINDEYVAIDTETEEAFWIIYDEHDDEVEYIKYDSVPLEFVKHTIDRFYERKK